MNITHVPGTGANQIVATGKCILHRIIVGADVASADVEVSDSATDGDGNVKIQLTGSTLMTSIGGSIEVGAIFQSGIALDVVNQTKMTFIWDPIA